jgi:tRNA-dihydrouridine synthase 2
MDTDVERLWGDGKLLLGPMVRASSLPLRLSALSYGADVVYSEEIPAHRAAHTNCTRISNEVLNTVDFVECKKDSKSPLVLFRTHVDREVKARCCVLQLGTSHATTALRAAQLFERDVTAIDINMGCAKHYSVSKGMGSALMERPEVAEDIVKTLRRNLSIPISVKTRIFDPAVDMCGRGSCDSNTSPHHKSMARSLEWLQRLQVSGVHAVTVHMRSSTEKNRDAAHTDLFGLLHAKMRCTNTPLVYNGDIWGAADVQRVRESVRAYCPAGDTDTTAVVDPAVMVCRAGLWNPAIFTELRRERDLACDQGQQSDSAPKPVELSKLLRQLVVTSAETANCPLNTRYLLQQILAGARKLDSEVRERILRAYTLAEVAAAVDIEEEISNERARQTTAWEGHTYSSEGADRGYEGFSSTHGSVEPTNVSTSSASFAQQLPSVDSGILRAAVITKSYRRYLNAQHWPGIVSLTSHEYSDRYFDDNYYVAFSRPAHCRSTVSGCPVSAVSGGATATDVNAGSVAASSVAKRPFAFSGFMESNTTVVRVKKSTTVE